MPTATPKKRRPRSTAPGRRARPTASLSAEAIAAVETRGRTQLVKLPRQFHLDAKKVRIRRDGQTLVLEPVSAKLPFDVEAWYAEMDRLRELHGPFLPEGRPEQPPMPPAPRFDD